MIASSRLREKFIKTLDEESIYSSVNKDNLAPIKKSKSFSRRVFINGQWITNRIIHVLAYSCKAAVLYMLS